MRGQFLRQCRMFGQYGTEQAQDLLRHQQDASARRFAPCRERRLFGGQRVHQAGALQGHGDQLLAQFLLGAQRDELQRQLAQARQLLDGLDLRRELQANRRAMPLAVLGARLVLGVESGQAHALAHVDQRRKTHRGASADFHFHQLGQGAEGPGGEARESPGAASCCTSAAA
jgi:hypothetical protein